MHQRILVTGGAGFIGSNFIIYVLNNFPGIEIINLDALTYAGNLENLVSIQDNPKYRFVKGSITDIKLIDGLLANGVDSVINFAAESHVDRSIEDPGIFVETNIKGTQVLLDSAKKHAIKRFLQVSTDEVYGSLGPTGLFSENTPLAPNSPYSASKTGADLLVRAYHETFGMDTIITRCSNNYGPFQFPEKLIPLIISNALENKQLPVYGDGLNVRDWLYVEDHCSAIWLAFTKGTAGEVYNIGGSNERTNINIIKTILNQLGKPESLITYVKDRPGHDRRYAIDSTKIQTELNWKPAFDFDSGIKKTIDWYCSNSEWWSKLKSGEYRNYYEKMYTGR